MKLAFLYAGQGSQHAGMGQDLYEAFPAFRAAFDEAAAAVEFDLKEVCFTDTTGVLNETQCGWRWPMAGWRLNRSATSTPTEHPPT